jgi:hypothetical protein
VDDLDGRPSVAVLNVAPEEDPAAGALAQLALEHKVGDLKDESLRLLSRFWKATTTGGDEERGWTRIQEDEAGVERCGREGEVVRLVPSSLS